MRRDWVQALQQGAQDAKGSEPVQMLGVTFLDFDLDLTCVVALYGVGT
jgi:hypothetical protein